MIRKCTPDDLDAVLQIWLETNIAAHSFIPESYWRGNLEAVRAALPQADVYVCTDEDGIAGFIGLDGSYIAGIFVRAEKQSRGAGRQLLDHAKRIRPMLTLHVYE